MTATAVERLLETIDEEDAIRPRDPNHDRLINPLPDDIEIERGFLELPGDRPMALLLTDEKSIHERQRQIPVPMRRQTMNGLFMPQQALAFGNTKRCHAARSGDMQRDSNAVDRPLWRSRIE